MDENLTIEAGNLNLEKNYQVIKFDGELDKSGLSIIKDQLRDIVNSFAGQDLIFDLANLKFINSEGIGYLMEIHSHLTKKGKSLVILGTKPNIADVFDAIGMNELVDTYESLEEYLNS